MTAERVRNQLDVLPGGDVTKVIRLRPDAVVPREPDPGVVDALALVPLYADERLLTPAREVHRAVADRAFGLANLGALQVARVPQVIHDGIANSVYSSISAMLQRASQGLARAGARGVGPRLDNALTVRAVHSAVQDLIGDRLREELSHLSSPVVVRHNGRDVPLDPPSIAEAYPRATQRLVVFVHGLGEDESDWEHGRYELGGTYGSRLQAMAGWTPVYLRLDTSQSVSANGVALTALLQRLVDQWPMPVRRISLVGHSVGALVVRAACTVATSAPLPWTERVSDVITLGAPSFAAALDEDPGKGPWWMRLTPETRGVVSFLEERSIGARDLERGLPELPALPHVRYRVVTMAPSTPRSPLGWLTGDLLTRLSAAQAESRALRLFPDADMAQVSGDGELTLLNHPDAFTAIKRWLR